ncbi:MAG: pseudaminic acid biosynthesis-associated methylase [Methanoregulaceae archaeon]|jgi:spore coat polysaccharide biosynthesis protein SpsF
MKFRTSQEEFWAGSFGDSYIDRNKTIDIIASNTAFFSRILTHVSDIHSAIEFGSNIGLNLVALRQLLPSADLSAIEINEKAAATLKELGYVKVYQESILDFVVDFQRDFVFTKGVLIHINPDMLSLVYEKLHQASRKYICVAEYYNPVHQEINYRGHTDRLFKRDFAGDMLGRYPDLHLLDYGFVYRRDNNFPQDDITWFLMEKKSHKE